MIYNNKRSEKQKLSPKAEKAASWIAGNILKWQRRWAVLMSGLFNRLSIRGKRLAVILFSTVMVAYCFLIVYSSLTAPGHVSSTGNITKPRIIPQTSVTESENARQSILEPIHKFRKYLDSLEKTQNGKEKIDSFLKSRPGLMDSVNWVESIYTR